jgi:DNA-directed RNA polymerase subunit L
MVIKASLLDTIYLITDFLAGGVENSSTNLTSQNALLREIYEERYTLLETMRHLLTTEEQITLVRLKSKLVLMEHHNV